MEYLIVVGVLFGLIGPYVLVQHFSARDKLRRSIKALPRTDIADVERGQKVKLVGRVRVAGEPLTAPLSGERCVAWECQVALRSSVPYDSAPPKRTFEVIEFRLEDDTGIARVTAERPRLLLQHEEHSHEREVDEPAWLSALTPWSPPSRRRETILEGALKVGAVATVVGTARFERDPEAVGSRSYREAPERLVLNDRDEQVVLSDLSTVQ